MPRLTKAVGVGLGTTETDFLCSRASELCITATLGIREHADTAAAPSRRISSRLIDEVGVGPPNALT